MKAPMTIDDHEASRFIVAPLRLLDYCLINDGAVCLILTTKERAADLAKPPVLVSGFGGREAYRTASIENFEFDFWHGQVSASANDAFAMADVGRKDVDALMCYDNFSPTVLFSLEGLGFCERGEAGCFRRRRGAQGRRAAPHQHRWRPSLQLLHAGLGAERRGGPPVAGRMRRATGAGLRGCRLCAGDPLHARHRLHARLRRSWTEMKCRSRKMSTGNRCPS